MKITIYFLILLSFLFSINTFGQNVKENNPSYSNYIISSDLVFLSGQIGTKLLKQDNKSFQNEVKEAINNIKLGLESAGSSLEDIVSVTVYLKDMKNFKEFNEIYLEYFQPPYPTRTCVGVNELVLNATVEITVVAAKN